MTDPISLAAVREARERPNADCIKHDDEGREMQLYALYYKVDGRHWTLEMWAYSFDDAQTRVDAMLKTLMLGGQIYAVVPR